MKPPLPTPESARASEFPGDDLDASPVQRTLESHAHAVSALERAVGNRAKAIVNANGPGRIGVLLSGGVDSAVVVGELVKRTQDVCALTLEFEGADGRETTRARKVAQHLGIQHEVLHIDISHLHTLIRAAIDLLEVDELWEVTAAVAILAAGSAFSDLLEAGRPVISGGGADVILGGGNAPPRNNRDLANDIHHAIRAKFTRKRLVPDFYEKLWPGRSEQHIQFFQTRAMVEATQTFGLSTLYAKRQGSSVSDTFDKYALRILAEKLEIPLEVAWAPKEPLQTSAGIIQGTALLAREVVAQLPNSSMYRDPRTEPVDHALSRAGIALIARASVPIRRGSRDHVHCDQENNHSSGAGQDDENPVPPE